MRIKYLMGEEVLFDRDDIKFNNGHKRVAEIAYNYKKTLERRFGQDITCAKDMFDIISEYIMECIYTIIIDSHEFTSQLISGAMPPIENYIEDYFDIMDFTEYFREFEEEYIRIVFEFDLEEEKRQLSKSMSGGWVGGGFGIRGAIAGAIQAEILNLGSSIINNLANSISRSIDRKKANKQLEALYENPKIREDIISGVFICCLSAGMAPILEAISRGLLDITFNLDKSTLLIDKYEESHNVKYLIEALKVFPYGYIEYKQLIKETLGKDKSVLELAEFVGYGKIAKEYRDEILIREIQRCKRMPEDTEKQLDDKIRALSNILKGTEFRTTEMFNHLKQIRLTVRKKDEVRLKISKIDQQYADYLRSPKIYHPFLKNTNGYAQYIQAYNVLNKNIGESVLKQMIDNENYTAYAFLGKLSMNKHNSNDKYGLSMLEYGARMENALCCYELAKYYYSGRGTVKDSRLGKVFMDRAFNLEYPLAIDFVACSKIKGENGYTQDKNAGKNLSSIVDIYNIPKERRIYCPEEGGIQWDNILPILIL